MSSANSKAQEPSMEEILASIRRIISDEQETLAAANAPQDPPIHDEGTFSDPADEDRTMVDPLADRDEALHPEDTSDPFQALWNRHEPLSRKNDPPVGESLSVSGEAEAREQMLLSDAVSASISSAFGRLEPNVQVGQARTLEDIVKDMLHPMLKSWLDLHLPPLVERLVQAEIERIARTRR